MTFVASYRHTIAGARRIAMERGSAIEAECRAIQTEPAPGAVPVVERAGAKVLPFRSRNPKPVTICAWLDAKFPPYRPPAAREIVALVATFHGLTTDDIFGLSREVPIVAARFDAICEVYRTARIAGKRYSLSALGRLFNRDHTTCLHALRKRGLR